MCQPRQGCETFYQILTFHKCGSCGFSQNLHTRKLGEITVFHAVPTVYTLTKYFAALTEKLQQNILPVTCDEGVFRRFVKIFLQR